MLAVGAAKLITVVDLNTGATILKSHRHGRVRCVSLSASGSYVVSGSFDSTLELVDMTAGARLHHFVTGDTIRAVSFSADAKLLAGINASVIASLGTAETFEAACEQLRALPLNLALRMIEL